MGSSGPNGYLRHVDGLRGVSVLLVVLYHAWPDTVPGGFIGVDVFFVISGFLITRLLLAEQVAGTLGYRRFLMRRVRRLWPGFALVLAFTLLTGWFLLDADALADLGRTALATIGLSSNWYFAATTDYFNEGLAQNLLLHSWSLAVEEQFYLVYPLLLIGFARVRGGVVLGLSALWAISFASVFFIGDTSEAFFATHLRAWELASGALLWCAIDSGIATNIAETRGRWLGRLGLIILVLMAFLMPRQIWWPSLLSLLPMVGAVLCIAFPVRGLEARWLVGLGLISYALYLWHWPVLKGLDILWPGPPDGILVLAIFASIGLAWLAWRYVEEPIRRQRALAKPAALLGVAGLTSVMLATLGWQYHAQDGFIGRFSEDIIAIGATHSDTRTELLNCKNGIKPLGDLFGLPVEPVTPVQLDRQVIICTHKGFDAGLQSVLYVGDSHLSAIQGELSIRSADQGTQGIFATLAACPPVLGVAWEWQGVERSRRCQRLQQMVLDVLKTGQIDKIVLVAHWDMYAGETPTKYPEFAVHFERLVETYAEHAELHVMLDVPTHDFDIPPTLIRAAKLPWLPAPKWLTRSEHEQVRAPYVQLMRAAEQRGELTLHDPVPVLCPDDVCIVQTDAGVLYIDGSHVSQTGAAFVLDALPDLPH